LLNDGALIIIDQRPVVILIMNWKDRAKLRI